MTAIQVVVAVRVSPPSFLLSLSDPNDERSHSPYWWETVAPPLQAAVIRNAPHLPIYDVNVTYWDFPNSQMLSSAFVDNGAYLPPFDIFIAVVITFAETSYKKASLVANIFPKRGQHLNEGFSERVPFGGETTPSWLPPAFESLKDLGLEAVAFSDTRTVMIS